MTYFTHAFTTAHTRLSTSQCIGNLGGKISPTKASKK